MSHLLVFETTQDGDSMTVHADVEGLRSMVKAFQRLLDHAERGNPEHDHLMTEDWGGGELSSEPQRTDETVRVVHHVKLYGWPTSAGVGAYAAHTGESK
jgi:Immunity protein 32